MKDAKKTTILIVTLVGLAIGQSSRAANSDNADVSKQVSETSASRQGQSETEIITAFQKRKNFNIHIDLSKRIAKIRCDGEFGVIAIPTEALHPERYTVEHMDAFIDSTRFELPKSVSSRYTIIVKVIETNGWIDIYSEKIGVW
jgi:hypothetical protein